MKTKGLRKSQNIEDKRPTARAGYEVHPQRSKLGIRGEQKQAISRITKHNTEYYDRAAKGTPLGAQAGFKSMEGAAARDKEARGRANADKAKKYLELIKKGKK